MADTVVVGNSPGAMRAAAWEAHRGASVVLLAAETPHGLVLPEGRGIWAGDGGEAAKTLYGEIRAVELDRAIWFRGKSWLLPMKAEQLARLVPPARLAATALGWAAARGAVELAELIGGGHEQRSYSHWIARRFGNAALETLYQSYCRRRFGEPDEISCNAARLFHGTEQPGPRYAPTRPLSLHGVTVQTAKVLHLEAGKVITDQGTVEGRVVVDAPPQQVLQWLGEPTESAAFQDAARLGARHRVTVFLKGSQNLAFETHVVEDSVRFYRVIRPGLLPGFEAYADRLCVHYALEDSSVGMPDAALIAETVEGLGRLGIQADGTGATVQRGSWDQPRWEGVHLSRLRRHVMVLEERGITPVGRAGLHSFADPSEEIGYLTAVLDPARTQSIRVCLRDHVEPPVDDPPRAHLRRYLER